MNTMFADRIMEIYKPGDIVVVHDHQLMLLPSLLRQRIPSIYVGFFLHIPFPSSEIYRCLTQRKELLEGVLGSNMVGFQSFSYSRHFSSCCTRVLGFESSSVGVDAYGAHVALDTFPIGINAQSIYNSAFENPVVDEKMAGILKMYAGKKIIIGRDRMNAIRGVAQKLQAFELFLEHHPEWRDKVVLIQITSTSDRNPEQEAADKKYVNKIGQLVSRINGLYGSLSHAPVQHYPQYLAKEEYLALMRVADLGLITSVRDGMNTTSLEYVVCQRDKHSPLILSEFSGTAGSLSDAIHVNPWDLHTVAESINKALLLPEDEKKRQHEKLYSHVTEHDIRDWTDKLIDRLLTNLSSYDQSFNTPVLDRTRLLEQYRGAKRRLFMFDYDGTLTPIVRDPQAAIPSDRILRTLKTLASDPKNSVWIISGRDQKFLDEWMGHISELGLSAEHGSFIRWPGNETWENIADGMDMSWRQEVLDIFTHYTERTQGSFVETKKIALTWHYRRADPEYGAYQANECQRELEMKVARRWDVEVMTGKANLEVRPRFVNKGEIAKKLIAKYSEGQPVEFVLCLGDDYTDEGTYSTLLTFHKGSR
jgi:trehalose 6-phosphate synthase/phosphatase